MLGSATEMCLTVSGSSSLTWGCFFSCLCAEGNGIFYNPWHYKFDKNVSLSKWMGLDQFKVSTS